MQLTVTNSENGQPIIDFANDVPSYGDGGALERQVVTIVTWNPVDALEMSFNLAGRLGDKDVAWGERNQRPYNIHNPNLAPVARPEPFA